MNQANRSVAVLKVPLEQCDEMFSSGAHTNVADRDAGFTGNEIHVTTRVGW